MQIDNYTKTTSNSSKIGCFHYSKWNYYFRNLFFLIDSSLLVTELVLLTSLNMTRLPTFQSWKPESHKVLFSLKCLWFHHFAVMRWSFLASNTLCVTKSVLFLPIRHSLKGTSSTTSDHSFPPLWTKKRRGNEPGIHPPTDLLSPSYPRGRSLFGPRRSRALIWRRTRGRIFLRRWSGLGRLAPCCDAGVRRAPCRPCVPPEGSQRDCRLRATTRSGTVQHVHSPTADCCYAARCVKVHEMHKKVKPTHTNNCLKISFY